MNVPYEFSGRNNKFSNFYPSRVIFEKQEYFNGEAAFQAAKLFDPKEREEFTLIREPSEAKRRGRQVKLRGDWEQVKFGVMLDVLRSKFSIPEFREVLLATGDREIIEVTTGWHDNEYGDCRCPKCKNIKGQNMLGKLLMQVREEIRGGYE